MRLGTRKQIVKVFASLAFLGVIGCASTPYDSRTEWEKHEDSIAQNRHAEEVRVAQLERERQARTNSLHIGASLSEFRAVFGGDISVIGETLTTKSFRCHISGEPIAVVFTNGKISSYQVDSAQKALELAGQQTKATESQVEVSRQIARDQQDERDNEHLRESIKAIEHGFNSPSAPVRTRTRCYKSGEQMICDTN